MAWGVEDQQGWRKGPWTPEEDTLLIECVNFHGEGRWSSVARFAGLNRSGKSCRLRWVNYLRPGLKRGQITPEEEGIIIELHALWGNKWSTIARYLPGRTDNEIKNYWRTHFKKKQRSSQKQEKRKTQMLKLKHEQQQLQVQSHDPNQDLKGAEAATAASRLDGKATEVAPQQKQDIVFMYATLEDQCLPVMMAHQDANQMDDDFLWSLEDDFSFSDKINPLQIQGASNHSFRGDSGNLWNGGSPMDTFSW